MAEIQKISAKSTEIIEGEIVGKHYADESEQVIKFSNTTRYSIFGFIVIMIGFVGAGAWATNSVLDSAFESSGVVIIEGKRKSVQHLEGGIIEKVFVSEGQHVEEGETLVQLNTTISESNLERIKLFIFSNKAKKERLLAERQQKDELKFSESLIQESSENSKYSSFLLREHNNFKDRKKSHDRKRSLVSQRIKSLESEIATVSEQIQLHKQQIALTEPRFQNLKILFEKNIVRQEEVLDLEQQLTVLRGELKQFELKKNSQKEQLVALGIEKEQIQIELSEKITLELSTLGIEIEDLNKQYDVSKYFDDRQTIKSSISGSIQSLTSTTVGGIIAPGEILMEIIPTQQSLMIEASVSPEHRDNLTVGHKAQVLFVAFDLKHTPAIFGKIHSISGDVVFDQKNNSSYFRTLIEVDKNELSKLQGETIAPGMPAQVMISTGEQTLWTYLAKPVMDAMRGALNE